MKKRGNVRVRYARKIVALGLNVRRIREGKGLSQEELADAAGISLNSVNTLENGKLNPTAATLYAIADALGIDCRELMDF